jgi:glycosyltransferase involved in cell wall biosynthesis
MSPSLKVVVPTLNSYHILDKLVDSLLTQTYSNWSVLFVDGHSDPSHLRWLDFCCLRDQRFSWISQSASTCSIFGAMNDGLPEVLDADWILFWGSDDWASSSDVFERLISSITLPLSNTSCPDLIVCQGLYVNPRTLENVRVASFLPYFLVSHLLFRASLFLGRVPPHQATLFSPRVFNLNPAYDPNLRLASDLDFFLRISQFNSLIIHSICLPIVCMSPGGVSSRQPMKRLKEVAMAYARSFGPFFPVPFFLRYFNRILDLYFFPLWPMRRNHSI